MTIALGLAARLGGIQIWDWSDPKVREEACKRNPLLCQIELAYDQIYVAMGQQALLVGSQDHFLYRMHQLALNDDARKAAREHIRRSAQRVLGEPWKLSDEN